MVDDLLEIEAKLIKLQGDYIQAKHTLRSERKAYRLAKRKLHNTTEARNILQHIAQSVQQRSHDQLAGIVSKCLEAIFDDPYEFRIIFERKRGRTEARLVFFRAGNEVNPRTSAGGSCMDVAAFALRLSALLLARPAKRRLLVPDEPFRFLSPHNLSKVGEMMRSLAHDLDVQIIMATNDPKLTIGKVIDLDQSTS